MKKRLSIIPAVLLFMMLAACGSIRLSGEKYPVDAADISVAAAPEDFALLDSFENLESVDFSGSTCLDEILFWSESHPDVTVRYTVPLPTGEAVPMNANSLDLSRLRHADVQEALACLKYLPGIREINLGRESEDGVTREDYLAFREACPDVRLEYSFSILGTHVSADAEKLNLSGLQAYDLDSVLEVLPLMENLREVRLGTRKNAELPPAYDDADGISGIRPAAKGELSFADVAALEAAAPAAEFSYKFLFYGKTVDVSDTVLDLNHIQMTDEGAAVREILPCMKNLTFLDMDSCGVSSPSMAAIRDDYPNVKVVWRVWFGDKYSVRTDVERILASRASIAGMLYSYNTHDLMYCTDVRLLDIGHSEGLDDIFFVGYMTKLEVAIVAMGAWTDCSPLANCPNLEYLEMQTTRVSDISPLAGLTKLKHLNICYLYDLCDISPLYGLTQLERLWIGCLDPVPDEQVEEMQRRAPNCVINTTVYDPTDGDWRYIGYNPLNDTYEMSPRYALLHQQFGYTLADYAFYWNDPLYDLHD